MKDAQKPDHISLNTLIGRLRDGRFVIPDFQREFEWKPWDIRDLMRSAAMERQRDQSEHPPLLSRGQFTRVSHRQAFIPNLLTLQLLPGLRLPFPRQALGFAQSASGDGRSRPVCCASRSRPIAPTVIQGSVVL